MVSVMELVVTIATMDTCRNMRTGANAARACNILDGEPTRLLQNASLQGAERKPPTASYPERVRQGSPRRSGVLASWRMRIACVFMGLAVMGCGALPMRSSRVTEEPAWELASAQPSEIRVLGRARVDLGRQIPGRFVTVLCDEFALVLISEESDWVAVRDSCEIPAGSERLDFSRGAVVGLAARVGERSSRGWPTELQVARVLHGEGWLEFSFGTGLYYPVKTAAYLEMAYVSGLQTVRMVQVGRRCFVLPPVGAGGSPESK